MTTLFSTCKPFKTKRLIQIQNDAIKTWLRLEPKPDIIIFGKDDGVAECCDEHGIDNCINVEYNEYGIPLLSSMFERVEKISKDDVFLLVSSDIVLSQKTMTALEILKKNMKEFCGVCRKTEHKGPNPIDFSDDKWFTKIVMDQTNHYSLITSGDFFMYTRGMFKDMPKFSVGRCWCDSWLFHAAMEKNALVDLSEYMEIFHLKHDYSHLYKSNEFETNKALCGNNLSDVSHANWKLVGDKVVNRKLYL